MKIIYSKQILWFLLLGLFIFPMSTPLHGQKVAKGINYQAVLRDASNKLVADKSIKVVISIFKKEINGELVWEENHSLITNKVGIFTLVIGQGTWKAGSASKLSEIKWGTEEHLLKVDVEIGSSEKISFPATPMLSVPYAFFADSARVARADFSGVTFDPVSNTLKNNNSVFADLSSLSQTLQYDPTSYHLSITGKPGIVDLRQFAHTPQDLRTLNNKLWVTGNKDSTVVDLSPYKQTLSVSSTSKLLISGGNEVQVDTSNVNEIQILSLNGNKVALSRNGGEVTIDPSETNEIQDLSLNGNTLKVTGNASATPIDLSKYLDNTDNQTLTRSGNNLSISGGNQVDVGDMINPTFIGFSSNNLGGQSILGSTETTLTWSEEFDQGNGLDNNKFTAPTTGFYNLNFNLIFLSANQLTIKIYKNGSILRTIDSFGTVYSHNLLVNLSQGDYIIIKIASSAGFAQTLVSGYFSGFKVN